MPNPTATAALASFQNIPVDQIRPSSHQARKTIPDESIQHLADSMKAEGLLQPIVVRRIGEPEKRGIGEGDVPPARPLADSPVQSFELVSGERRLRAARRLGWETIDARVIQTVSEAEAAAKGLVENLQ